MVRNKRNKKNYFDSKVEEAILIYKNMEPSPKRDLLYAKTIHPALKKLAEVFVNKTKMPEGFSKEKQDLVYETIEHLLYYVLPRLNENSGRAYSYFTKSTYNFLKVKIQEIYSNDVIDRVELSEVDNTRDLQKESDREDRKTNISLFIKEWVPYYYKNMDLFFKKEVSLRVAEAVVAIFRDMDSIDVFNKKAIFFLIRENTNLKTSQISPVLNVIRTHFKEMLDDFINFGYIDTPDTYLND